MSEHAHRWSWIRGGWGFPRFRWQCLDCGAWHCRDCQYPEGEA